MNAGGEKVHSHLVDVTVVRVVISDSFRKSMRIEKHVSVAGNAERNEASSQIKRFFSQLFKGFPAAR